MRSFAGDYPVTDRLNQLVLRTFAPAVRREEENRLSAGNAKRATKVFYLELMTWCVITGSNREPAD
jgi:hypothetical protein